MKFTIAYCLAALATLGAASAATVSLRAETHSIFNNARITNGQDASPNSHPYQISLQWRASEDDEFAHSCGATIVHNLWIVTAAHCITQMGSQGTFRIVAGGHDLNVNEATQQTRNVIEQILHPSYAGGATPHDIALLKLESPLVFNDAVAPISLPEPNTVHTGDAILSGWGSISTSATPIWPNILQVATMPLLDTELCWNIWNNLMRNPPLDPASLDNVCTGPLDSSAIISACFGDSGGPLAQQVGDNWEFVGVVSWGLFPCGVAVAPSVFVRVSAYIDWINQYIDA